MADRDRALAARGHRDAGLMGTAIAEEWPPDLILCSPARRTRETMEDIVAAFAEIPKTTMTEVLYGAAGGTYLRAIAKLGGRSRRLLVIGHNPTIHQTAVAAAKAPGEKLKIKFPTCALAIVAFDIDDWADLRPGEGELVLFLRPKDLGARDADD